jgi:hypothetical protein
MFKERAEKFLPHYVIRSGSYKVQSPSGELGWIALGEVWDDKAAYPDTLIHKMYPTAGKLYSTEAEAEAAAMWGALKWLEDGMPPLPDITNAGPASSDR